MVVGSRARREISAAVLDGAVIAIPLPGGYALATSLGRPGAADVLSALGPTDPAGLQHALIGADAQATILGADWTGEVKRLTDRIWPGPLTVIVEWGGERGAWQISMPQSRTLRAVCRQCGPLLVGSPSDASTDLLFTSAEDVASRFSAAEIALVVDGGTCRGPGMTVVDCRMTPPLVRHVGALPEQYIEAALLMGTGRRKWFSSAGTPPPPRRR
jgi:L-threonylcarbamoyladenylate synthase